MMGGMTYPGSTPSGQQPSPYGVPYPSAASAAGATPASRRAAMSVLVEGVLLVAFGLIMMIGLAQLDAEALAAGNPAYEPGQEQAFKVGFVVACGGCAFLPALPLFILFPFIRARRKGAIITAIVLLGVLLLMLGIHLLGVVVQAVDPSLQQGPALEGPWLIAQLIGNALLVLSCIPGIIFCALALRSAGGPPAPASHSPYYPSGGYASPPYPPSYAPQQGWGAEGGYPGSEQPPDERKS